MAVLVFTDGLWELREVISDNPDERPGVVRSSAMVGERVLPSGLSGFVVWWS